MAHVPAPKVRHVSARGAVRYHRAADPSAVYRIRNSADEVIYIGMSYEPDERVRVQRREKPWGSEIARHEVEWHPNRDAAKRAEANAIKAVRPRYNVTYTPEHKTRSLAFMDRHRATPDA